MAKWRRHLFERFRPGWVRWSRSTAKGNLLFLGASMQVGLAVLAAGCSDGVRLLPVTGTVSIDGQPVADAAVMFTPVDGGPIASATTDDRGIFSLATANRPGAVAGEHRVTVCKQITHNPDYKNLSRQDAGMMRIEWITPPRYSQPDTSGLRATVQRGMESLSFDLTSR